MILRDATPFQQQEDKTTLSLNAIIRQGQWSIGSVVCKTKNTGRKIQQTNDAWVFYIVNHKHAGFVTGFELFHNVLS